MIKPKNLYSQTKKGTVYYFYKRPDNGKFKGLGKDIEKAYSLASELNQAFFPDSTGRSNQQECTRNMRRLALSVSKTLSAEAQKIVPEYFKFIVQKDTGHGYSEEEIYKASRKLLSNCRRNAKARGTECLLTLEDTVKMLIDADMNCALTGVRMTMPTNKASPWQASIDRIDSSKTYTSINCRPVCLSANLAMGEWGQEVLDKLARSYLENNQKQR